MTKLPPMQKSGLRRKIILALLVIGTVPVVVGIMVIYFVGTAKLKQAMGNNFQGLATETARKVDLLMSNEIGNLEGLTRTFDVGQVVAASNRRYQHLTPAQINEQLSESSARWKPQDQDGLLLNPASRYLKNYIRVNEKEKAYLALFATDREGALATSINHFPVYRHAREDWWKETYNQGKGQIVISDLVYEPTVKAFAVHISVPILEEHTHQFLGTLKAVYNVDEFLKPSIYPVRFGETGHAMLIDSTGKVIICPILPTGSHVTNAPLMQAVDSPQPGWVVAQNDAHGGINSIVGFAPIVRVNLITSQTGKSRWHSFIRQDPKELYAPINTLLWYASVSGTVLIGVIVVLGTVISKRLVQPVHLLHVGAERIGQGDLDHRLSITTNDEIEQLADEFNRMAEQLKESYSNLEQRVADRTRELAALNLIASTVNESLDLNEILEDTLIKVLEVMRVEAGSIRSLNEEHRTLVLMTSQGIPEPYAQPAQEVNLGEQIAGRVAQSGKPILIENAAEDTRYREESRLVQMGFLSIACVPIKSKERITGTLTLASRVPRVFSAQDLQLLSSIGNQIGTALENARLYEREQQMVKRLKEMDRFKSEFLSNVSHELRLPLTSILGFSELLLDQIPGSLTEDQEDYIKNMQSSGYHLLEIINNLLDLSKIKAGKMDLHVTEFKIKDLVENVKRTVTPLINKKQLILDTRVSGELPLVSADQSKVKQILLNLLSNAIKFTPSAGRITISAWANNMQERPCISISVADTGIGIRPEDQHRIFDEFKQLDGTYTREYPGTGLGLTITKRFVEMQGGSIWVESQQGKGSTFTLTLPTQVPTGKEEVAARALSVEAAADSSVVPTPSEVTKLTESSRPTILVVEDDLRVSQLLTLYLTREGYQVEHALDGDEAIEKARALRPFAITLDIMLSKRDGWEVLQRLKLLQETKDIPVVIVSIIENRELGFSLGAADYFTKPIDRRALLESLKKYGLMTKVKKMPVNVLIIDDDPQILQLISATLEAEGFGVIKTQRAEEGISLALEIQPDLIILDLLMPEVNGFEALRQIKQHPTAKDIPVIISTAKELTSEDKQLLAGQIREVIKKGSSFLESLREEIRKFEKLYPDKARMVDGLTGLYNERYFRNRLADEVSRALRFRRKFAMILTNADHFRELNKRGGAEAGDRILKEMAELLRENTRAANPFCRWGGSTFAVILTETAKEAAAEVAEKMRAMVENHPFPFREAFPGGRLTISAGVTSFFDDADNTEQLITAAYKALEKAKRQGGNRVVKAVRERV
jgi:diguanylate cyclase (GGDEF)-like protein